jgi:hypothetical protein
MTVSPRARHLRPALRPPAGVHPPPRDSGPWTLVQDLEIKFTIGLSHVQSYRQGRVQGLVWRAQVHPDGGVARPADPSDRADGHARGWKRKSV